MLIRFNRLFAKSTFIHTLRRQCIATQHLDAFRNILGDKYVLDETKPALSSMNFEFTKNRHGKAKIALLPANEEQISKLMAYCNENRFLFLSFLLSFNLFSYFFFKSHSLFLF